MSARTSGRPTLGVTAAVLAAVALVGACGGGFRGGGGGPTLPTPMASLTPEVAASVALVRDALAGSSYLLTEPVGPYRPSEPGSLTGTPRTVRQVSLGDPDGGFVVVYALRDEAAALSAGRELAAYLGSGFGQTNYPTDAQFSVAQVGSTVVFTWWSRERSGDPDAAKGAFDLIRSVGLTIPVLK